MKLRNAIPAMAVEGPLLNPAHYFETYESYDPRRLRKQIIARAATWARTGSSPTPPLNLEARAADARPWPPLQRRSRDLDAFRKGHERSDTTQVVHARIVVPEESSRRLRRKAGIWDLRSAYAAAEEMGSGGHNRRWTLPCPPVLPWPLNASAIEGKRFTPSRLNKPLPPLPSVPELPSTPVRTSSLSQRPTTPLCTLPASPKVSTSHTTRYAPAVTHEVREKRVHEVHEERIVKEVHEGDTYHTVLPIVDQRMLSPRHFVQLDGGALLEVNEETGWKAKRVETANACEACKEKRDSVIVDGDRKVDDRNGA